MLRKIICSCRVGICLRPSCTLCCSDFFYHGGTESTEIHGVLHCKFSSVFLRALHASVVISPGHREHRDSRSIAFNRGILISGDFTSKLLCQDKIVTTRHSLLQFA